MWKWRWGSFDEMQIVLCSCGVLHSALAAVRRVPKEKKLRFA
jgi:hypothetical protein